MTVYIVENVKASFFLGKNEEEKKGYIKKGMKISNGLSKAIGIYQKCLKNIYTEFLANDGKFLSLIEVLHYFKG